MVHGHLFEQLDVFLATNYSSGGRDKTAADPQPAMGISSEVDRPQRVIRPIPPAPADDEVAVHRIVGKRRATQLSRPPANRGEQRGVGSGGRTPGCTAT